MNKLEFLSMSLPFGLIVSYRGKMREMVGLEKRYDGKWYAQTEADGLWLVDSIKPMVTTEIMAVDWRGSIMFHQDVFNLIDSGDAIDIEDLAINPYEK